jgi:hypothetical protein
MVERLVLGRDMVGVYAGGEGLDALPLSREAKADQVIAQRLVTIFVSHRRGKVLQVLVKPAFFEGQYRRHTPERGTGGYVIYDTVELRACPETRL